jgi:hypothetical protein
VTSVDVDLDRDLLVLTCDPGKVMPARVVEVVREQGFKGTIVPEEKRP